MIMLNATRTHIPRLARPLSSSDPHPSTAVLAVHSSCWYHEETETQLRLPQSGDLVLCSTILLIVRAKMLCPLQAEVQRRAAEKGWRRDVAVTSHPPDLASNPGGLRTNGCKKPILQMRILTLRKVKLTFLMPHNNRKPKALCFLCWLSWRKFTLIACLGAAGRD